MRFHDLNIIRAKRLGAFYTPHEAAEVLARHAIVTGQERVLEPSVGAGSLLKAATNRAHALTGRNNLDVVVCDIDEHAIDNLRQQFQDRIDYHCGDFLELDPIEYRPFDVILANPPFTRNHSIDEVRRNELRNRFAIKGAAGLWVHFLLHALSFLAPGGRLASIVPGAAFFSNNGNAVLSRLSKSFHSVRLFELAEQPRWIGKADEKGAILLAEGFKDQQCKGIVGRLTVDSNGLSQYAQTRPVGSGYERLIAASKKLSELADLSIGAVTGCNRKFLINEFERREAKIHTSHVVPIVSRAWQVRGLQIDQRKLRQLAAIGHKTWLVLPTRQNSRAYSYLHTIDPQERETVTWFKKRDPWWKVDIGEPCDAIFTYMNNLGPRLVLAGPGLFCTNTLHRVQFHTNVSQQERRAAALCFLTTFGQLAAEMRGRVYCGGVLKFELSEARAFPVLPAKNVSHATFSSVSKLVQQGDLESARLVADEALLAPLLGPTWKTDVDEMALAVKQRRIARNRKNAKSS